MCQQNINRHQQQHHQHLHHHYYIITIIINIIIIIIIIDLLGLNRKKIGQFSQCHTLLVSKRERWIVWVWWKIKSRLLPNASIFRLPSEPQINNFMQTIVEIWSTGNEESTQGIRDKRCATETWGALLKKKNLSRRRKLMPWYAIERCLLGVIKLIKTGT